jgi:uncharacterized protein (TIGR03382 family)
MTTAPFPARALGLMALLAYLLIAPAVSARAQDVGGAVVSPNEGGSATPFSVRLPDGSTCPGDSANDGYRVNSYMVPGAVDPAEITYDGLGPTPAAYGDHSTFREPLFDIETNSFASAQTADAETPGEPGPIISIPMFSFGVYAPGDLPAGRYHIGIACTLINEIVTIWDAEIVVTRSNDDEPAQIRWRVADGSRASTGTSNVGAPVAVLAVVVVVLVRRRRQHLLVATSRENR